MHRPSRLSRARTAAIRIGLGAMLLGALGCSAPDARRSLPDTDERLYDVALYDGDDRLIHSPIEQISRTLAQPAGKPISDVYVLVHGWNYTLEESARQYEAYRTAVNGAMEEFRVQRPDFRPFLVFVSWASVTRPLSTAADSLSPFGLPSVVDGPLDYADTIAFQIPSNWGETQHAFRIALGTVSRRRHYEPLAYASDSELSEYRIARRRAFQHTEAEPLVGIEASVSALLDELIRMRCDPGHAARPRFRLHVIGHSFGAKLASLAAYDAAGRLAAARLSGNTAPHVVDRPYIDSLVLVEPALRVPEMYYPPFISKYGTVADGTEVTRARDLQQRFAPNLYHTLLEWEQLEYCEAAAGIGRSAIAYSEHDSANGWLFGLSQLVLSNDALAEGYFADSVDLPLIDTVFYGVDIAWTAAKTVARNAAFLLTEPARSLAKLGESTSVFDGARRLLRAPISGLLALRAIGNQGFATVRSSPYFVPRALETTWLSDEACAYLTGAEQHLPEAMRRLSERPDPAAAQSLDWSRMHLFDASTVYDGFIEQTGGVLGEILNFVWPAAAHSDLRSLERSGSVSKRDRTLHWVFNLTQAGR